MIQVEVARLLESEGAVVAAKIPHRADEHLAQRGVHVEEKRPVDVPGSHLAEVGLIPADPGRLRNLVKAGPKVQQDQGEETRVPG